MPYYHVIPNAVKCHSLAKATIRNVKQNTAFAVITVFALLAGVLYGSIHHSLALRAAKDKTAA